MLRRVTVCCRVIDVIDASLPKNGKKDPKPLVAEEGGLAPDPLPCESLSLL